VVLGAIDGELAREKGRRTAFTSDELTDFSICSAVGMREER
jgi:hypothetical protein